MVSSRSGPSESEGLIFPSNQSRSTIYPIILSKTPKSSLLVVVLVMDRRPSPHLLTMVTYPFDGWVQNWETGYVLECNCRQADWRFVDWISHLCFAILGEVNFLALTGRWLVCRLPRQTFLTKTSPRRWSCKVRKDGAILNQLALPN